MAKITYGDKVGLVPKTTHENQVWDDDMNEIKSVVNENDKFIQGYFTPTATAGRTTFVVGDVFMGQFGDDFIIARVEDNTLVLPGEISSSKVKEIFKGKPAL